MSWFENVVHAGEKALDMLMQPSKLLDNFNSHTTTPELELGQTTNPRDLIRGDPGQIQQLSQRLQHIGGAAGETASGLSRIEPAHWHGPAADAFHGAFGSQPRAWSDAATAFDTTATAAARYGETISWAQQQAQQALDLYRQGVRATAIAKTDYDRQVKQYQRQAQVWNAAVVAGTPPSGRKPVPPRPFVDPGQAARDQAQAVLTAARQQRDEVAADTQHALATATQSAPPAPSENAQFGSDLADTFNTGLSAAGSFIGGVGTAAEDLLRLIRQVDPLDPQNVTHPAEYLQGLSTIAAGVVHSVIHPSELITGLVGDSNSWKADPMAAFGRLTGNAVLAVGTGGIGAEADAASAAGAVGRAAERLGKPREQAETPKLTELPKPTETPKPANVATPPEARAPAPTDPQLVQRADAGLSTVERELDNIHTHDPGTTPHHERFAYNHTDRHTSPPTVPSRASDHGKAAFDGISRDLSKAEREIDDIHTHTPGSPADPALSPIERVMTGQHRYPEPEPGEPYLDPNSGVLRNKLGITDPVELASADRIISTIRADNLGDLLERAPFMPMADAFRALHRDLFGDVYDWAGEFRSINITKGGSTFTGHDEIESMFAEGDQFLRTDNHLRDIADNHTYAEKMAMYWDVLNRIHPFREGNGRTTKLYLDSLARASGRELDWDAMPTEANHAVAKAAADGNRGPMIEALLDIIRHTGGPR